MTHLWKGLIIFSGDTNIDINNLANQDILNFTSILTSLRFKALISNPTRINVACVNPLQAISYHIWVNKSLNACAGVLEFDLSDHCPTFLKFSFINDTRLEQLKKIVSRPFNEVSLQILSNKLMSTNWSYLIDYSNCNLSCPNFMSHINRLYCDSFPLKTKFLSTKRIKKPWMSNYIKSQINLKSYYFKLYRQNLITKQTNNTLKNRVIRLVKEAKQKYYIDSFNNNKSNSAKTWNVINELSGRKRTYFEIPKIRNNGNTYESPRDIANEFIDYFSTVASKLECDLPRSISSPTQYLTPNANSFFLFPITIPECYEVINSVKNTKSSINEIPPNIFKSIAPIIISLLCDLFNTCFEQGICPDIFKIAKIIPIHKEGPKDSVSNYRPISLVHFLSKIFEKLLARRIISFFNKFSLFSRSHFGFLKGKATSDAILSVVESIYEGLNSRMHHVSVLIDLKKAFDTVNIEILCKKLEIYGIRGTPLRLLRSFLSERKYWVGFGQVYSDLRETNIGIHQGSALGPLLFLIYINELPDVCPNVKTTLFADDTTVSHSDRDYNTMISTLNNNLERILDWMTSNRLTINVEKTEAILITNRTCIFDNIALTLNNSLIPFSENCTYLGTVIDNKLNFSSHIGLVISKVARHTGNLFKIKHSLPLEARIRYYYAFIYPYLSNNILVWGGAPKSFLNTLFLQQKKIIRVIADAQYCDHTDHLFRQFRLLKLNDIYKFNVLLYMFNSNHDTRYSRPHHYMTRHSNLSLPTFQRLSKSQNSIHFVGPTLWDNLPDFVKCQNNNNSFKIKLKKYFISNYCS